MRSMEGSMTVEASVLMPMLIFILIGVLYSLFFVHDTVILQSYGYAKTEDMLWNREDIKSAPVSMLAFQCTEAEKSLPVQAADWMGNQSRASALLTGEMKIGIPGAGVWTGNFFKARKEVHSIRVDYTRDRVAAALKDRKKSK